MNLVTTLINELPKLVWIALCKKDKKELQVLHGSCVECGWYYCVSGVWDGEYQSGDFDKTDIIAGTGLRVRESKVIFVTPANTLDRIVYYPTDDGFYVSNSLPAIFTMADIDPLQNYDYQRDFETIIQGLRLYRKTLPTSKTPVHLVYFNNLEYDGKKLEEVDKPDCAPHFNTFSDYEKFLFDTGARVASNAKSSHRKLPIKIVSTCSSGYDSALATVIAKHMGCSKVLSIGNAQSLLKRSDSGEKVAAALNLPCEIKDSCQKEYKNEEAVWASMADGGGLHLSVFDFPKPVSLMLTAFHGDMLWERTPFDLTEFLHRHDPSGASFNEWGLHEGVVHMSIGFWAIRRGEEIQKISILNEMKPWTLYNDYDRPIPRRIIEEAGVPRGDFGNAKRVASIASDWLPNPRPYSKSLKEDFEMYAQSLNVKIPHLVLILVWKVLNTFDWHVLRRISEISGKKIDIRLSWVPFKSRWIFFNWAINRLKKQYKKALNNYLLG